MKSRRHHLDAGSRRAFTLLEVLIATLIFAVVLAAMNAAFYSALRLRSTTTRLVEESLPLQHACALMKADLRGALAPGGTLAGAFTGLAQTAGENQLTFSTTTGVLDPSQPWGGQLQPETFVNRTTEAEPWADVQQVSYYLRQPGDLALSSGKDLVRAVTRNPLAPVQLEVVEQVLLSGVAALQFSYYDGTAWRDSWDSTTSDPLVPLAVKARIELAATNRLPDAKAPLELLAMLVMQPSTNATNTATSN
jgi:type II secretion system protein J